MTKKVLFVLSSAKTSPWGKDTGYWLEEVASPYNLLIDAGYTVEISSIAGGEPPLDLGSTAESFVTEDTVRFVADTEAKAKMAATKPVADYVERAKAGEFAAVFLPGGHGAALDFQPSVALKSVIEGIYASNGAVAAVCHGCAGLMTPLDTATGLALVSGKKITGFSDTEETQVGLFGLVPFSIEAEFKKLGAIYEHADAWHPKVCVDHRVVTGQNPQSSKEVGVELVKILKN
jgi:putative intracellular protease/amidase